MASRSRLYDTVKDRAGNLIANAKVFVDLAGTSTDVSDMYTGASGGSPVTFLVSDADGYYSGWFDTAKNVKLTVTDNGGAAYYVGLPSQLVAFDDKTFDNVAVVENPADAAESLSGTFAARPAAGTDGRRYYATDQGIEYRDNGSAWVRQAGDPAQTWVTDYGAVPGVNTAPQRAANVTAFNAAIAAVRLSSTKSAMVYVPMTPAGCVYYTDAPIVINNVSLVGSGNSHGVFAKSHDCSQIVNTTVGSGALRIDDTVAGISAQTTIQNIFASGNEYGLHVLNRAEVYVSQFTATCDVTGGTNNAAIVIENCFWINFDVFSTRAGTVSPTHAWNKGACGMMIIASDGGPISGIAQSSFLHGILDKGGIRFENRRTILPQGGDSAEVLFEDVLTENQGHQAFMQFAAVGATVSHTLTRWRFERCERADASGVSTNPTTGSTTAFYLDGGGTAGLISVAGVSVEHCQFYAQWVVQSQNLADWFNCETTVTGTGSAQFYDPSNLPRNNGFSTRYATANAPFVLLLQEPTETSIVLERDVGGGLSSTFALGSGADTRNRFAISYTGTHHWGDGTNDPYARLLPTQTASEGRLGWRAYGARAMEFDLDNSDATKEVALNFRQNGSVKWTAYVPGSSSDLRFYSGGDKYTFTTTGLTLGSGVGLTMNAADFATDGTTGTKFGTATTQKMGWWNATPIAQPTTGVGTATRVGGGGTTVTDTDTFDGYTIGQVVKALRSMGKLA